MTLGTADVDVAHGTSSNFPRQPVSLGPGGDHRVRVANTHFMPDRKYRGEYLYLLYTLSGAAADILTNPVCKLFMCHVNTTNEMFVGTGWLITR